MAMNGTNGEQNGASDKYIRWDAEGVEVEQLNEKQRIQDVSDQFNRFQVSLKMIFQDALPTH
jgi:hypothetical protein